jgi:predicted glycogen debranching enzyme
LTLALGLRGEAREILLAFAKHVDQGMLPNRFPDAGETPEYNTVDATLWFFEAVAALLEEDGEEDFVRINLYLALCGIVDWHVKGTRYGIRLDEDGLLLSGEPGAQLTWMDAKVGDWVVTPRHGKPVEIQALWYNALRILDDLADRNGDRERRDQCRALAELAKQTFNKVFWNQEYGCLFDVIDGGLPDPSIRPNQIFAISLRHPILDERRAAGVVRVVEKELFTPLGLRTLAPGDPFFRPRYEGGVSSRDGAYHQGTVWPWLLGPFISAYLRVNGSHESAIAAAEAMLQPLEQHLLDAGLGQISEILDAAVPHEPRGCPAQAWSVSETIRARQLLRRARQPEPDSALAAAISPVADFGA